jgi:hypothetical protein
MKMVGHEAKAVNLPAGFRRGFLQGREKPMAVVIIAEDQFTVIASIHHVVDCPWILDAHLPSHMQRRDSSAKVKSQLGKDYIIDSAE